MGRISAFVGRGSGFRGEDLGVFNALAHKIALGIRELARSWKPNTDSGNEPRICLRTGSKQPSRALESLEVQAAAIIQLMV